MSNWVQNTKKLKAELGLGVWDDIPKEYYVRLANMCGPDEVQEIKERLEKLKSEEKEIPDWDGDSQDDSWKAREFFKAILKIKGESDL
jgi:hypothetical protein